MRPGSARGASTDGRSKGARSARKKRSRWPSTSRWRGAGRSGDRDVDARWARRDFPDGPARALSSCRGASWWAFASGLGLGGCAGQLFDPALRAGSVRLRLTARALRALAGTWWAGFGAVAPSARFSGAVSGMGLGGCAFQLFDPALARGRVPDGPVGPCLLVVAPLGGRSPRGWGLGVCGSAFDPALRAGSVRLRLTARALGALAGTW